MADHTTDTHPERRPAAGYGSYIEDAAPSFGRRISWSAIIAGIVLALAIQFTLGLLGTAIGFSFINPQDSGESGPVGIGAAIYTILSQIVSLVAGGFVAARLSGIPRDTAAFIHGALVWAGATFAMLYFAVSSLGALAGATSSILGTAAKGTTQTIEAVLPEDLPSIPTPELDLANLPEPVRETLQENQITVDRIRQEVGQLYNDVISEREERRVVRTARRAARDMIASPSDIEGDFNEAIDQLFGQGEPLSREERRELVNAVQESFGLNDREAEQIVNRLETAAEEAAQRVEEAAEAAQTEIAETTGEVADTAASTFYWLFTFSVLGLIAACFGGRLGEPAHLLLREERGLATGGIDSGSDETRS